MTSLQRVRTVSIGVCVILSFFATSFYTASLHGDHGSVLLLPVAGKKMTSGLSMEVDTRWVEGPGYQPVRIKVSTMPPIPAAADRLIRIELTPNSWSSNSGMTGVTDFIEIPQGATTVTKTILVPRGQPWNSLRLICHEGSLLLEDLDENLSVVNANFNAQGRNAPTVLFIDDNAPTFARRPNFGVNWSREEQQELGAREKLPDVRRFALMFPQARNTSSINITRRGNDFETLTAIFELPDLEILPFADLPERWQAYSCFDLVFINWPSISKLAKAEPARWTELQKWLRAGGTLIVYNVGEKFDQLPALSKELSLPTTATNKAKDQYSGWAPGELATWAAHVDDFTQFYRINRNQLRPPAGVAPVPVQPNASDATATDNPPAKQPKAISFVTRDCGLGRVAAVIHDPFVDEESEYWSWLLSTIGRPHTQWTDRHGLSLTDPNNDFWNFLIPGVGRAPVGAFLLLISAFMVVIGPMNYFYLQRRGKLVLLLITVPVGSALVTLALLGHAIFADGLGTRVRVRSYTELDQTRQNAISWSRQSYYAGLAPSRGLSFPDDTAVYPLEQFPPYLYGQSPNRRMDWRKNELILANGFIHSRTITQVLVQRAWDSKVKLAVDEKNERGTPPATVNQLAAPIRQLVFCDQYGDLYWSEKIPENGRAELTSIQEIEARARLSKIFSETEPRFPDGYDSSMFNQSSSWRRRYMYYGTYNSNATSTESSLLEVNLKRIGNLRSPLPPRSYVALLEHFPEVPIGAKAAEVSGFHVVRGSW